MEQKDLQLIKNKKSNENDEMIIELLFKGKINDVIDNFAQNNKKEVFKNICMKRKEFNI